MTVKEYREKHKSCRYCAYTHSDDWCKGYYVTCEARVKKLYREGREAKRCPLYKVRNDVK